MYLIVLLTVIVYFMIEYINKNWLHWIKLLNYIYWKKN